MLHTTWLPISSLHLEALVRVGDIMKEAVFKMGMPVSRIHKVLSLPLLALWPPRGDSRMANISKYASSLRYPSEVIGIWTRAQDRLPVYRFSGA